MAGTGESTRGTDASASTGLDPERWVDDHGDALYRFAMLRLREPNLAEELVQETFMEALRVRGSYGGRSAERTWLIGILRHKILDHFRRAGRRREVADGAAYEERDRTSFDDRGHWRASPAVWRNPAQDLERSEFWQVFDRCLAEAPRGLADAFFLRELDGLDGPAVCEALGITPANLWARLHRARLLLRRCLELRWFGDEAVTTNPGGEKC